MGGRWVATVALGVLVVACSDTAAPTTTTTTTTASTSPAATTTAPPETTAPPPEPPIVDWGDPSQTVAFDGGWVIAACEGDAPLLCVERGGELVGVVEALAFPVDSFPDLDPAADGRAKLAALAAGFTTTFEQDRAAGCGADYRYEPIAAAPFDLGSTPGLAYGFTGTLASGDPSELNLQYAAIVDDEVVLIVATAYDEGGCPGRDDLSTWDSATLAEFRPRLESVLQATPLPEIP